jgi:hypothetical protein
MSECLRLTVEVKPNSCINSMCISKEAIILGNLHQQDYVWQKDCLAFTCLCQLDKQA